MANPSPQAIAAIQARVTALGLVWAGQSGAAILAALKADTIDNPTPQGTVPKPYTVADLMACADAVAIGKIYTRPGVADFRARVAAQDATGVLGYVQMAVAAGDLTTAQQTAMQAVVTATQHDPNYQPKLVVIEQTIGRPIDLYDVQASRPGA